ncbi:MAG: hypothetical protein JNL19_09490 [Burkholderiales bacterium]|nr:hypothetical protein [Burkholderiales bacterium]
MLNRSLLAVAAALALCTCATTAHAWVWTSTDGVTYDAPLSARTSKHASVNWINGQYVAVGMMTMTSSDGINWKQRLDQSNFGTIATHTVAGIAGRYSSGVANSAIYTSTDSIRWAYQSSLPPMGAGPARVASNGSNFLAVVPNTLATALIYRSSDGLTWNAADSAIPPVYAAAGNTYRVRYLNGRYIIVYQDNYLQWSADGGTSFSAINPVGSYSSSDLLTDLAYDNSTGLYLASVTRVGTPSQALLFKSTDLQTWTPTTVPASITAIQSMTGNGNGFTIAVTPTGSTGTSFDVYRSPDGASWTKAATVPATFARDMLFVNGTTFIATDEPVGNPAYAGPYQSVTTTVTGPSGAGSVYPPTQTIYSGATAYIAAVPASGYALTSVTASGCTATRVGNEIQLSAFTSPSGSCSVTVRFGVPCNLDVDGDGQVLAQTDGVMILRRMLGLTDIALTNAAYNPAGTRTGDTLTGRTDIRNYIDTLLTNNLTDIDGNSANAAATDGVLLLRALSGYGGTAATTAALGTSPVPTRSAWSAIYDYLSGTCGLTNLAPRATP